MLQLAPTRSCRAPCAGPMARGPSRASSAPADAPAGDTLNALIIGGTGRIGTAAAAHLLQTSSLPEGLIVNLQLAGRSPERGAAAVAEVQGEVGGRGGHGVSFLPLDMGDEDALKKALAGCDVVIHTAGPYEGSPDLLRAAIACGVPAYVDLADPLPYLEEALEMSPQAKASGTVAVCSAGAFPGLSNVLAVECAAALGAPVADLKFNYFTAGLGGSGVVNLLITNLGFGEPVGTYRGGNYSPIMNAGLDNEVVRFYIDETDASFGLVGEREVWAWPFPEVATVAKHLGISGSSDVKMGTAPWFYNGIMSTMVKLLPREWWRSEAFSTGLAKFSEPMVAATDPFVGETHAIRVDVAAADGTSVTAVQAHESFRRCVGQSAAEFAADIVSRRLAGGAKGVQAKDGEGAHAPGVYLPEGLYARPEARGRVLRALTSTQGTVTFRVSGPVNTGPTRLTDWADLEGN